MGGEAYGPALAAAAVFPVPAPAAPPRMEGRALRGGSRAGALEAAQALAGNSAGGDHSGRRDYRLPGGPAAAHGGDGGPGPGTKRHRRGDRAHHLGTAGGGGDHLLGSGDHPAGLRGDHYRSDHQHGGHEPAPGGADRSGAGGPGRGGRVPDPDSPGQSGGPGPALGAGAHHEGPRHDGGHGGGGVSKPVLLRRGEPDPAQD